MEKLPSKLISTVLYKKNIHAFFISRIFLHSDWIRKDTEYGVSLRIQSECEKMWTRITPITDTFHAGNTSVILEAQNHLFSQKIQFYHKNLKFSSKYG